MATVAKRGFFQSMLGSAREVVGSARQALENSTILTNIRMRNIRRTLDKRYAEFLPDLPNRPRPKGFVQDTLGTAKDVANRLSEVASHAWNVSVMGMDKFNDVLTKNFLELASVVSHGVQDSLVGFKDLLNNRFIPANDVNPKLNKSLSRQVKREIENNPRTALEESASLLWEQTKIKELSPESGFSGLSFLLPATFNDVYADEREHDMVVSRGSLYYGYTQRHEKSRPLYCNQSPEKTRMTMVREALHTRKGQANIRQFLEKTTGIETKGIHPNVLLDMMDTYIHHKKPMALKDFRGDDKWVSRAQEFGIEKASDAYMKAHFRALDDVLSKSFVFDNNLTKNSPILVRDEHMMRLSHVSPAFKSIEEKLGQSYSAYFRELYDKSARRTSEPDIPDMVHEEHQVFDDSSFGGIKIDENSGPKQYTIYFAEEDPDCQNPILCEWNGSRNIPVEGVSQALNELPDGTFPVVLNDDDSPKEAIGSVTKGSGKPSFIINGSAPLDLSRVGEAVKSFEDMQGDREDFVVRTFQKDVQTHHEVHEPGNDNQGLEVQHAFRR